MNYGFKSAIDNLMDDNPMKINFYKKYNACVHDIVKTVEVINNETVYRNECKQCDLVFYTEND